MQTEGARDRTNNLLIDLLTYSYAAIPTELPEIWISCIPLFVVFLHQPYAQHLLQKKQRQQKSVQIAYFQKHLKKNVTLNLVGQKVRKRIYCKKTGQQIKIGRDYSRSVMKK